MDKVKSSLKTLREFKNQFQVESKENKVIQMKIYFRSTRPSVRHTSKKMRRRTKRRRRRRRRRRTMRRRRRRKRKEKCASRGISRSSLSSSDLTASLKDSKPSKISATLPTNS